MKSGVYTLLNKITDFLAGFGVFLLLVRILPKEEFGVWILYITIGGLLELTRYSFVLNAFVKYSVTADAEEYKKILKASYVLNLALTVISVFLLLALGGILSNIWKSDNLQYLLYLYAIVMILYMPFTQAIVVMQSKFDFKNIFYSQLLRNGGFFLVVLFVWIYSYNVKLYQLVEVQIVFAVLTALLSYLLVRKHFNLSAALDWEWVKKLFHFSKYVFGTVITSTIANSMDKFLIGGILNTAEVATFNASTRVLNLIDVPLFSITSIVFPKSAERMERDGKHAVKYLYERSIGLMMAMAIPFVIFCYIFAEQIILIIAGKDYLEAVPLLRIVVFLSLLKPFDRQSGSILDAIGKPKLNFITVIINFVLTIALLYTALIYFGIYGAAIGLLVSLFIAIVITHIILYRLLGINPFNVFIYAYRFYADGVLILKGYLMKAKE
jgi:lipopolysaccharide exporter